MRELTFIQRNTGNWAKIEDGLKNPRLSADDLAELYVQLTNDLSYAQTFYPGSEVIHYLNQLSGKVHQLIYRNKKEKRSRIQMFFREEVPEIMHSNRRLLAISFLIFTVSALLGFFSSQKDDSFVRLILGDGYVNMTLDNIEKGNPLGVYGNMSEWMMFLTITFNNMRVALVSFVAGIFFGVGAYYVLFKNGVMVGAFLQFFFRYDLGEKALKVIFIHGAFELSAIVVAGAAGLVLGRSMIFAGTLPRTESIKRGAKAGLKIVVSTLPFILFAGILESFVTRYTEMPLWLSLFIILGSFFLISYYYVAYPFFKINKHAGI
ncbi:MAG: stage II sporulation protein M [Cytophagales bacterium]|nr:stage II sporulation protein M [Cytophagales bacterium]